MAGHNPSAVSLKCQDPRDQLEAGRQWPALFRQTNSNLQLSLVVSFPAILSYSQLSLKRIQDGDPYSTGGRGGHEAQTLTLIPNLNRDDGFSWSCFKSKNHLGFKPASHLCLKESLPQTPDKPPHISLQWKNPISPPP